MTSNSFWDKNSAMRRTLSTFNQVSSKASPSVLPLASWSKTKISARKIIQKRICTHARAMPTTLTYKSMVSKQAAGVAGVAPAKRSVSRSSFFPSYRSYSVAGCLGRVAAGAIAEKYLNQAHGIEIVAFVSSVGKIRLPSSITSPSNEGEDDDEIEDALSPEFCNLLATVTREEVDKFPTRCPHPETSERMTKVRITFFISYLFGLHCLNVHTLSHSLAHHPSQRCPGLDRRDGHLRHSQRSCWAWRTCL